MLQLRWEPYAAAVKGVEGLNGAPEESMVVDRPTLQAAGVAFSLAGSCHFKG